MPYSNSKSEENRRKQSVSGDSLSGISPQGGQKASIQEAFARALDQFGPEILENRLKFSGLLADYAPGCQRERQLITYALSSGIEKILFRANDKPDEEKTTAILVARKELEDKLYLMQTATDIILSCFIAGLHWNIELPQMVPTAAGQALPRMLPPILGNSGNFAAAQSMADAPKLSATDWLALGIVARCNQYIRSGGNRDKCKDELAVAADYVVEALKSASHPIKSKEDYENAVGRLVRSERDRILLTEVILDMRVPVASIMVDKGKTRNTYREEVSGYVFDRDLQAPGFATNETRMQAELELSPYVLVTNQKIDKIEVILPVLEKIVTRGGQLLMIADDFSEELLSLFVVNKQKGTFQSLAIKAPGFGDRRIKMLEDIAIVTGATCLTSEQAIVNVSLENLGRARKVVSTGEHTAIANDQCDKRNIQARIEKLKAEIAATTSEFDKEKLQERFYILADGVTSISIGGNTENEVNERAERLKDALFIIEEFQRNSQGIVDDVANVLGRIALELVKTESFGARVIAEILPFAALPNRSHIVPSYDTTIIDEIVRIRAALGNERIGQSIHDALLPGSSVIQPALTFPLIDAVSIANEIL